MSQWIRREKRHAIYARDAHCCRWCGAHVLVGVGGKDPRRATLDHVTPRAAGGSNERENLVTSCVSCNSGKGDSATPRGRDVGTVAGIVAVRRWLGAVELRASNDNG